MSIYLGADAKMLFLTNQRFLLARLYMDLLCQIPTKRRVSKALDVLPEGIDETYSEAWHRVCTQSPDHADLGKRILLWIIHATRPLRVQELRHAIAIEKKDEEIDPDGLLDVAKLTSFCAGLVIVDEQRGLFSLVHPTTQEYFDKHKDVLFPAAHETIAATCITYLRMKPFRNEGALDDFDAFSWRRRTCHFLGYAAVNWGLHAAMAGSEQAKDDSLSLINNECIRAAAWQALQLNIVGTREFGTEWPNDYRDSKEEFHASRSYSVALHVAAYFGLISVVQTFLELGYDVDQIDGTGRTPLHWAITGKQNTMLESLLKHGANANARIADGNETLRRWSHMVSESLPLALAARLNNGAAIECLLHYGAEINKISTSGRNKTALSAALYTGRRSATKVLLENGADVNVDIEGLKWAAEYKDLELLKLAVDAGANSHNIQHALVSAAASGNYDAVVFLVEHGANANGFGDPLESCKEADCLSPKEFQTPLVASAASVGLKDRKIYPCFRYLIEAGANVDRVCARRWGYGNDYFISLDLENNPGGGKTTALHTAAYHGRLDMVRILVERGADIHLSLGEQHTALSSAIGSEGYYGKEDEPWDEFGPASSLRVRATIGLLVDLGADPKLCKDEEIQRMETLFQMSSADCEMVAALQTVFSQLRNYRSKKYYKKSFRERVSELKKIIAEEANLELCCDRDKKRISRFLAMSEAEIVRRDERRIHLLTGRADRKRLCAQYNNVCYKGRDLV